MSVVVIFLYASNIKTELKLEFDQCVTELHDSMIPWSSGSCHYMIAALLCSHLCKRIQTY